MANPYHFKLAMPDDVKEWLNTAAQRSGRSRTMHIIYLLREEMKKEETLGQIAKPSSASTQLITETN